MFNYIFPLKFGWLIPDMKSYYIWVISINATVIASAIILIWRIWAFKEIEKSKKRIWTWLMILFNSILILIFIWRIENQMAVENQILSNMKKTN
jgi:hypothetical protein